MRMYREEFVVSVGSMCEYLVVVAFAVVGMVGEGGKQAVLYTR